MAVAAPDAEGTGNPWVAHRSRAEALRDHHPFAAEMLTLYLALLEVWDSGWRAAGTDQPDPARLAPWAAKHVLPQVVVATEAAGPDQLAKAARDLLDAGGFEASLTAWLAGEALPPVERYLARASLQAPLVALGDHAGTACAGDPSPRGDRRCPRCGAAPQLSVRGHDDDPLVSGRRHLVCARCTQSWAYSGSSCPSCGETSGSRRTVHAERRDGPVIGRGQNGGETAGDPGAGAPTFPHLRIAACQSCERYLIDIDLGRDPRAVPEVDELAAVPLDLYAAEHGLLKITPNLMGF
jgi:FdhE protein